MNVQVKKGARGGGDEGKQQQHTKHTLYFKKNKTYLWTAGVGNKKAWTLPAKQLKAASARVRRTAAWCMVMMMLGWGGEMERRAGKQKQEGGPINVKEEGRRACVSAFDGLAYYEQHTKPRKRKSGCACRIRASTSSASERLLSDSATPEEKWTRSLSSPLSFDSHPSLLAPPFANSRPTHPTTPTQAHPPVHRTEGKTKQRSRGERCHLFPPPSSNPPLPPPPL